MEPSFVTALAAAGGSIVGGAATVTTTWINQRTQTVREQTQARLCERERLYGEFITEASRLAVAAVAHSLETLEQLVILYGILGRIRLISSEDVLAEEENCCRRIIDLYATPNITVEQVRTALDSDELNPLKPFSAYLPRGTFEDFAEFLMSASKPSKRILQNPSFDTKGDVEYVCDANSIAHPA